MKRSLLLILFLNLAVCCSTYSQDNFIPGQITTLKKVVIEGLIDYQNWSINPSVIRFKKSKDADIVKYKANEIIGFKTKDEEYIGKIIDIDQNSFDYRELLYTKKPQITKDTVFLQTLFTGEKNLYFLFKANGRSYFFIPLDGKITPLAYHKYLKLKNGQSYLAESKRYIGQLNYYFRDAREFQGIIQGLEYTREDITNLFEGYYSSEDFIFKKERENAKFEIKPLVGISISNMTFVGGITQRIAAIEDQPSTHLSFGVGFDLILSRNRGRWSFNNDILYTNHTAQGENFNETIYSEIAFGYVKLHSMARYKYFNRKGSVFFNAGFTNGFIVSETNYSKEESLFTSSEGFVFRETKKHEIGVLFGLGVNYKHISLEARIERGNGATSFLSFTPKTTRCYFLLGYRI